MQWSKIISNKMVLRDYICLLTLVLQLTTTWGLKQGSLTFVIDGTGSMENDISYVIDAVDQIIDDVTKTSSQIENIVLVAFNDNDSEFKVPDAQLMIKTTKKNQLKAALKKVLVEDSGGDCPEMAMTGIKLALENSHRNSYVFVFTDAPPKDSHLTKEVIQIAQAKDSKVVFVVTPGCANYSNSTFKPYEDVAVATYGLVFPLKQKSEVQSILDYVKLICNGDISPFQAETLQASNKLTAVEFTVDHSTRYVIISATGQRHVFMKGMSALPGTYEPVTWLANVKVLKVMNLPPGKYKVMIKGHSVTTVMISGRTDFIFQYGFSQNKSAGLQNTDKQPTQGRKYNLLISVNDTDRGIKLESAEILNMEQKVIEVLPLRRLKRDFFTTEKFMSPNATFLVAVSGSDIKSGDPIRRIAKTPITPLMPPPNPEVTIMGKPCCYPYNSDISLICKVKGPPPRFITWKDSKGKILLNMEYIENSPWESQLNLIIKMRESETLLCEVNTEVGVINSTIDVKIDPPFEIPSNNSKGGVLNANFGKKATLFCNIKSSAPMQIIWTRKVGDKYEQIATSDKFSISSDGTTLTINKMSLDLQAHYICKASLFDDKNVTTERNIKVKITDIEPPKIQKGDDKVTVSVKKPVTIECKIQKGKPEPKIVWQFIRKDSKTVQPLAETGNKLLIKSSGLDNAGEYVCNAENVAGHDKRVTEVIVKASPTIVIIADKNVKNVTFNSNIFLTCKVIAYPEPMIVWKDNKGKILKQNVRKVTKHFYEYKSSISVEKIRKHEQFYCYASNSEGTFHEYADVIVQNAFNNETKSEVINTNYEKKATLFCNIKSSAPMQIIWTRKVGDKYEQIATSDKFSISSDGTTLTINKMSLDLQGHYICKASLVDDKNVTTERNIEVKITDIEPPKIQKGDDKVTVSVKKPVTIECKILKGNPEPKIVWQFIRKGSKTAQPLAVTGNKLVINNSSLVDAGDYVCNAENVAGYDKRATEVIVKASPNIIFRTNTNLKNVPYNSKLSLTYKVTAYPEPIIVWKDSKGNVLKHNALGIQNSSHEFIGTFSVDKIKESEVYSCQATNSEGKFIGYIEVTVGNPFNVMNDSEVMDVKYGRAVSLLCNIKSSFLTKIMWIRKIGDKQETIETSDNIVISSDKTTLTIKNMTLGDQGKYTCKVSLVEDEHKEAQRHIKVKICDIEPPKIEKGNSILNVKVGTPITIECKLIKGYPKSKVAWQFIRKGSKVIQPLAETSERLVIKNSNFNDAGNYLCTAENVIGQDKWVVEVIIEAPPKIIVDNNDAFYTALQGDDVLRIPCKVTGYPKPNLVWKINGQDIREKHSIEDGTLVIDKPVETSSGEYTCRAENKLGTDERIFEAYVTETIEFQQDYGNYSYVYLLEGETKPLICPPAKSSNDSLINWYKDGLPLIYNCTNWMITNADPWSADGNYTCRVSNHLGTKSHTLIVDIGSRPTFVSVYHRPLVDWDGENQLLNCETVAKPDANVNWTFNGKVIPSKRYSLSVRDWGWGNYTCQATNVHGTINRSFKVTSSGCLIKKNSKIGQMPLLLTTDLEPTWPRLKTKIQYLYLKRHSKYLLSCNTKKNSQNVLQNLAKTSAVVATCDHEDKFKVNGKIFKFEDLQCESRVEPTINATGEECLGENTELLKVGFEDNYFVEVYEVCFDKTKKVPLFTKMVLSKALSATGVEECEWYDYPEFGKDKGTYNCTGVTTCCLSKGQLVNGRDVMYGPAHTATFVDHLNSVPLWHSCASDKIKNWSTVEDIYRGRIRFASNFTLWTGASNYINNNGLMIPRYLWKAARFPYEGLVAIIHVNDPSPVAEDVLCESKGACRNIRWFKSTKYTYCCPFDEFLKAFNINNLVI